MRLWLCKPSCPSPLIAGRTDLVKLHAPIVDILNSYMAVWLNELSPIWVPSYLVFESSHFISETISFILELCILLTQNHFALVFVVGVWEGGVALFPISIHLLILLHLQILLLLPLIFHLDLLINNGIWPYTHSTGGKQQSWVGLFIMQ